VELFDANFCNVPRQRNAGDETMSEYAARDLDAGKATMQRWLADPGTGLPHHIATAIAAERGRIAALLTTEAANHPAAARHLRAVINAIEHEPG